MLVAKIDNSGSEPQVGLGKADLVVEELVEGGTTRLAAFYYSELPTNAGPVRSMRFSDIGIVKPVDGDIVTSGAAPVTIKRITGSGIHFFGEGAKGFSRDSTKHAPYNLMADLKKVAAGIKQDAERPPDYLRWGKADATLGGQPATTFSASFSGSHTSEWKYVDGRYELLNGNAPGETPSCRTPCWCCGSGPVTRVTGIRPGTRFRRRTSPARRPPRGWSPGWADNPLEA